MKNGDILAEHFMLKAQRIRMNMGIFVLSVWLFNALFAFFTRVAFGIWILNVGNAPKWMWAMWILSIPSGMLIEQIETKSKEK